MCNAHTRPASNYSHTPTIPVHLQHTPYTIVVLWIVWPAQCLYVNQTVLHQLIYRIQATPSMEVITVNIVPWHLILLPIPYTFSVVQFCVHHHRFYSLQPTPLQELTYLVNESGHLILLPIPYTFSIHIRFL